MTMALKSMKQAAETWGVSVYTVRRLANAGRVLTVTVGRRRLIPESEIARIVAMGVPCPAAASSKNLQPRARRKGGK